jgi:hypothetical protein
LKNEKWTYHNKDLSKAHEPLPLSITPTLSPPTWHH